MPPVTMPDGTVVDMPEKLDAGTAQRLRKFQQAQPPAGGASAPAEAAPPAEPSAAKSGALFVGGNIYKGLADIAGLPVDTALNVGDLAKAAYAAVTDPKAFFGSDLPKKGAEPSGPTERGGMVGSGEQIQNLLRRLGVITPESDPTTPAGRLAASGIQAGTSALAGRPNVTATSEGGAIMEALKQLLKSGGAGAASGAASQGAAEAGLPPSAQVLASQVPGMGHIAKPAIQETVRKRLVGDTDAKTRLEQFQRAGVEQPPGSAVADSKTLAGIEAALSRLPGSGGTMDKAAEARNKGFASGVEKLKQGLAPGGAPTREEAGGLVQAGAEAQVERFKKLESLAYRPVDRLVPPTTPITLTHTLKLMDALAGRGAGLQKTESAIGGGRSERLRSAAEELRNRRAPAPFAGVGGAQGAEGYVPFSQVSNLRTQLGAQFTGGPAWEGLSAGDARKLYAAMSQDIRDSLPDARARKVWDQASSFSSAMHDRYETVYKPLIDFVFYY